VSSTYHECADAILVIDPLIPGSAEERDRFLNALDRDVERARVPVSILLTIYWHERSAAELAARYGASIWAPELALRRMQITVSNPFAPGDPLPGGAEALDAGRPGEVLFWLPGPPGGVRLLPDSWLKPGVSPRDFRRSLRHLLDLPVDVIVLAHGDPVLERAREALERVLSDPRS
jgi:hypothetical protein